jgi:hypothetical protein
VIRGLRRSAFLTGPRLAHRDPTASSTMLDEALRLGARFLARRQGRNGVWKGFRLPPGAATSWLTAHVAYVVEDVDALSDACRRASDFLEAVGPAQGGWAYNGNVGVDVDSSAQALLVLGRFARPVPEFLVDALLAAQLPSGGFPTYAARGRAPTGWNVAHEDVTALAAESLRRRGFHSQAERATHWLSARDADPTFASYWWTGPAYGIWVRARTGVRSVELCDAAARLLSTEWTTPELAHGLAAGLLIGGADPAMLAGAVLQLLRTQLADGSWPCSACLRVTDPTEVETALKLRGRCYADGTRIFSTSHALAALQAVRGRLELADAYGTEVVPPMARPWPGTTTDALPRTEVTSRLGEPPGRFGSAAGPPVLGSASQLSDNPTFQIFSSE